jgi:signal transduction histidine kinase
LGVAGDLINQALPLLATSFVALATGVYVLYRRIFSGKTSGIWLVLVTSVWSISYSMGMVSTELQYKSLWFLMKVACDTLAPMSLLLYVMDFLETKELDLTRKLLLWLPPLLALAFLFTNNLHQMVFTSMRVDPRNAYDPMLIEFGNGFWVLVVNNYAILLLSLFLVYKVFLASPDLYRTRITTLLLCISLPWITQLLYEFGLTPNSYNMTPFVANLAAAAIALLNPDNLYIKDVVPNAYNLIIDELYDAVIVIDSENRILDMNSSARSLTKLDSYTLSIEERMDFWPSLIDEFRLHENGAEDRTEIILLKGGVPRTFDVNVSSVDSWSGQVDHRIIILRDVTERIRYLDGLEAEVEERTRLLRNAERMAAIGETAAMVGHDLRNPLQVIVGSLSFIKRRLGSLSEKAEQPEFEQIGDLVDMVSRQTGYMNKIVSDLQDFAKPIVPAYDDVDLEELMNDMMPAIEVPDNVAISIAFDEGLPTVWADGGLLRRVFTNLVTNAIQAMTEGGDLKIEGHALGGEINISIEDTGVGISEEAQANLFKPLITTKAKGMGLGLPVCKRMVEVHKGRIEVESEVGVGTTFTVRLPIGAGERKVEVAPTAESLVPPGSKLRV